MRESFSRDRERDRGDDDGDVAHSMTICERKMRAIGKL